ncbi:MAG: hypothetical protein SGILL_005162 [Bacillariaceae sp.]
MSESQPITMMPQQLCRKRGRPGGLPATTGYARHLLKAMIGALFLCSPLISFTTAQQQQELYPDAPPDNNRYYIGIPDFSSSNLKVSLEYPVANHSPLEYFRFRIFDGSECPSVNAAAQDVTDQNYLQTAIEPIDDFSVEGDGTAYRRMKLDVSFDPNTIQQSTILQSSPGELTATIGFCVQVEALTAEAINPGAVAIFVRETYVTIDIAQDGNLDIEQLVDAPNAGDDPNGGGGGGGAGGDLYYLEGYICDLDNVKIDDPIPIYLGQSIRVCVTPNAEARANNVYMRAVTEFAWTRGSIHQQAIRDLKAAHLTDVECEPGMLVCAFTTFLKMPFFFKLGWANGAGAGWLQFGRGDYTGDQRLLEAPIRMQGFLGGLPDHNVTASAESRSLQEDAEGPGSDGYAGGGRFVVEHPLARLYTAIGFLCDYNNKEIAATDYPLTYGMKARVCVRPDSLAIFQDDVRIRSIDRFIWEREDFNISQVAITTNAKAEPRTEIFCERGSQICAFETELREEFFRTSGIIAGKGIVWLQFGKDSRRNALGEEYGYEYELGFYLLPQMEPGFAGASPFEANLVVLPAREYRELYKCEVYECKGAENEKIIPGEPVLQGASIRMCVQPSFVAQQAGANMWAIEWWDWKRKNYTQPAIVSQGQEAPDGMTLQVCNRGDPICTFETRLHNMFFNDTGAMWGEGYCWLTFGKGDAVQGIIEPEDPNEEREEIDPSRDPLYAGSNPISYEFPVDGNYQYEIICPEEDHQLDIWYENLLPLQRFLIVASIVCSTLCCCLSGLCCLFGAWRDSRRDEEIETKQGNVVVNVEIGDSTKNEVNKADAQPGRNQHFDGHPKDGDVLFGQNNHPGTKACMKTIRAYMKKNPTVTYGPKAYEDIMAEIPQESCFLTRRDTKDPWRLATNHETIAYFGDIWKQYQR